MLQKLANSRRRFKRIKLLSLEEQYNNRKNWSEKDLKSLYNQVNLQKNEVKDFKDQNYDRTSQEYKDLTIVLSSYKWKKKPWGKKSKGIKKIDNLDNYLNDLKKI